MFSVEDLIDITKKGFRFVFDDANVSSYGWINSDGEVVDCRASVCHNGLNNPKRGDYIAIISQIMGDVAGTYNNNHRNQLNIRTQHEYYHWLMNESPFSKIFITKDVDQVFEDKFVLLGTEHSRNAIMAACMAHRYIWEEIKVPRVWMDLVDGGMDKDGAFVMSHFVNIGYAKYDSLSKMDVPINQNSYNSNHNVFASNVRKSCLKNFNAHEMPHVYDETYRKETDSADPSSREWGGLKMRRTVHGLFLDNQFGCSSLMKTVQDQAAKHLGEAKEVRGNPFDDYGPGVVKMYKYKDVIQALVKAYPAILKEDMK